MDAHPRLLDPLFRGPIGVLFNDGHRLQRMLDFEAALSRAEAKTGVIPAAAVPSVEAKCRAELFDFQALASAAVSAGNLAIPMVKHLTSLVASEDPEAARYVHWGATSQDVIDTGLILQLREAFDWMEPQLHALGEAIANLADHHRETLMVARTLLQQALPTTFGLKAAGWLDAVARHLTRMREIRGRDLTLQFGGAAGTLAALREKGIAVAGALADELKLPRPNAPWHSHHDRFAEIAAVLGLLAGTLGKIARDIALLMQTEVGEVREPSSNERGGSSAMPHKHNPVGSVVALAAATRLPGLVSTMLTAMTLDHERGVGGWHAEWETLADIVTLTGGSLFHMSGVVSELHIDGDAMAKNLQRSHGQIMAEAVATGLAERLGRADAQMIVEQACAKAAADGTELRAALVSDLRVRQALPAGDLEWLLSPHNYLGSSEKLIDRILASWHEAK
ncbi:MAG: 3-carboxy-cis,cis-muconate cycloisomerase [Deltaproteobacteria bacterium]|nr:3-carboxy-cis,cis-muconate cycloisomerase [Deltaproteobacteria bacterium]